MSVEIITKLGSWEPGMTAEEYARTQVTRTTDPERVAQELITSGVDPVEGHQIVIMGDDEEPMHFLNLPQAVAVAHRIIALATLRDGADR